MKLYFWSLAALVTCFFRLPIAIADEVETSTIPDFFMMPRSRLLKSELLRPSTHYTTQTFTHAQNKDVALRVFSFAREQRGRAAAEALTASGALESGDILLSFRPTWGRGLAYHRVQLGISHAGIVYREDDQVIHSVESPLENSSYLDAPGHYMGPEGVDYLHIIRPRLDDQQKRNLDKWGKLFVHRANREKLPFNSQYDKPKFNEHQLNSFVEKAAKIALGNNDFFVSTFCSEFVYLFLNLRDCDPDSFDARSNAHNGCIRQVLPGDAELAPSKAPQFAIGTAENPGLLEGPSTFLRALGLDDERRWSRLVNDIISDGPEILNNEKPDFLWASHWALGVLYRPEMVLLKNYYLGRETDPHPQNELNHRMARNYSPTSFWIKALEAPPDPNGPPPAFGYLGTVAFSPGF